MSESRKEVPIVDEAALSDLPESEARDASRDDEVKGGLDKSSPELAQSGHKGEIEVLSFSWGVSNAGS
jgi:hypothetical protein